MTFTHLHIPKTAGTSLRESVALAHPELKVQQIVNPERDQADPDADVVSGHISFDAAKACGMPIVTVLRHPVDRFVSIYFFWRELYAKNIERTRKTSLAHHLPLREFACAMDEPELASELFNRVSWQLHSDFRLPKRFETRCASGLTLGDLAAGVLDNLRDFGAVGFQDRYGDFVDTLNSRFDLKIENRKVNVTAQRSSLEDISRDELRAILRWLEADMEVYHTARKEFT